MDSQRLSTLFRTVVVQHPAALCALVLAGVLLVMFQHDLFDPVALTGLAPATLAVLVLRCAAQQRRQQRLIEQQLEQLRQLLSGYADSGDTRDAAAVVRVATAQRHVPDGWSVIARRSAPERE
jgi:hypothetical protein